ncbi:MAG: protease complex subunit PrcB family protein [Phycisphaeraceae bacterium]
MRMVQNFGLALIVAVAMMAGCKSDPAANITGATGTEPVEILKSHAGSDPVFKRDWTLINEKVEAYAAVDTALEPDYATQTVVVISLGEVPTGGFTMTALGAQRKGPDLFVQFEAKLPAADAVVTQATEFPYVAILIPKFEGTIVHLEPQD